MSETWDEMEARHMRERKAMLAQMDTPVRRSEMFDIAAKVAEEHRLSVSLLCGRERVKEVVAARHEAFAAAWKEGHALKEICRFFGRDRSTVLHGLRRMEAMQ